MNRRALELGGTAAVPRKRAAAAAVVGCSCRARDAAFEPSTLTTRPTTRRKASCNLEAEEEEEEEDDD